ncbi:hypothetical protein X985_1349 [Burkholderia pseudomallei MSHR4012]|uniref:hypothetical protein n=1 Tax=Burkholderia pseudomallei TaxID=28450 RepID=UPI00053188A9|nr:hypothetical protein [Burkholderia pseudomallei]KGT00960.1 hypothetical protein JT30_2176 [Burkholderia pseudomallei]KGV15861.1 hypothetical protein X881_3046 [Burkholderia pseudomallei MSHR4300]KGV45629.1 hypothetical protein X985_1349 [Burkholderia pseudomallei MSHR4012]KGV51141.1 hypothetical protein X983_1265 [Burkholderia pseudomallei MSHR4003]OMW53278.1 hypothetical protein AQ811_07470 [Burkholderia pseudomallei]
MTTQRWTLALAVAATGTAVTLSILSGWQRGGTLPERLVWVAIGVVLAVTAHLLPALVRSANLQLRFVAAGLSIGCMGGAVYGHATFFLLAQVHAGERRAAPVPPLAMPSGRSLTTVMAERAAVTTQLAVADVRRCVRDCPSLRVRRASLATRLDALNAEADDIRRQQAADDRITAQRDSLLADPVTSRLARLLGVSTARVDLLSGLAFAMVLEGAACLLWMLALRASSAEAAVREVAPPEVSPVANVTPVTQRAVTPEAESRVEQAAGREAASGSHRCTTDHHALRYSQVTLAPEGESPNDEFSQLVRDIAAKRLRPTVADIRRHLGCSQAKASALRRQLADAMA